MNHVVEFSHLVIGIGDDRKIQRRSLCLSNIFGPFLMGIRLVHTQANNLNIAPVEFRFESSAFPKLGCANRGEILGVGKKHCPAIADPLVELNRTVGRVRFEIGCDVA
jgi:hypothetical protein